jgi:hypothetical protein
MKVEGGRRISNSSFGCVQSSSVDINIGQILEGMEVDGRDSFHPKRPMNRAM